MAWLLEREVVVHLPNVDQACFCSYSNCNSTPIPWRSYLADKARPWDATANKRFADNVSSRLAAAGPDDTVLLAIRGEGTAFDEAVGKVPRKVLPKDSILLAEVCGCNCHWLRPADIYLDSMQRHDIACIEWTGAPSCANGFHVAFADGAVWRLKSNTPLNLIRNLANVEFARAHKRDILLKEVVLEKQSPL